MISLLNKEYEEKFRDLLLFDKDSQLKDIIEPKNESTVDTAARGILRSLGDWLVNYKYTNSYISSQLTLKVRAWRKYLDEESWNCRRSNGSFKDLQIVAKKIFCKQKTEIIRHRLAECGIVDAKLDKALKLFDQIIRNIVTTPNTSYSQSPFLLPFPIHPFYCGGLFFPNPINRSIYQLQIGANLLPQLLPNILQLRIEGAEDEEYRPSRTNSPIPAERLEEYEIAYKKSVAIDFLVDRFKKIDRSYGSGWEVALTEAFKYLSTNDEVIAVASTLTSSQAMIVLLHCFEDKEFRKRLPYFAASIGFGVFRDVLLAKEDSEIQKLNKYLAEADEFAHMWLNENLQKLFLGAIHVNNVKKDAIDFLAERFRFRLHWRDITFSDIKDIETLKDDVNINWTAIKKLKMLLDIIVNHPVREADLQELDNEYALFIVRLSEPTIPSESNLQPNHIRLSSSDPTHVNGCIYQIIYGHAFVNIGCDDDLYEGLDLIGKWSIATPKDYWEGGLLANFTQAEVSALQKQHGVSLMNYLASTNLRKVGLWYVRDFKKNKIFNRNMLKEYLSRPENLRKLQDDNCPSFDILEKWDIQNINQLINSGLLSNLSLAKQLELKEVTNEVRELVVTNLKKLGIVYCSDWKRAGIFNRFYLKDYLERTENKLKLLDDKDPPHMILYVWGLVSIQHFVFAKIFDHLSEEEIIVINKSPEKLGRLIDEQLIKIGIRDIRDIKRLGIDDSNSFQEYLMEDEIQKKFREG